MKLRWLTLILLLLIAPIILAACTQEATVTFKNEAQCGTATLTFRNDQTGNERTYTIEEGQDVEITVDNGISYHYDIEYERLPGSIQCDAKSGSVLLPNKGDTATFRLESVTPTPDPTSE